MDQFATDVYTCMIENVHPVLRVPGVENIFAPGSECWEKFKQAVDASIRIGNRLGTDSEDKDIQILFDSMSRIQDILAVEMFKKGYDFGLHDSTSDVPYILK